MAIGGFREEDERWMKDVLNVVPIAVYRVDAGKVKEETSEAAKKSKSRSGETTMRTKKTKKRNSTHTEERHRGSAQSDDEDDNEQRVELKHKLREKILTMRQDRKADDETHIAARQERKRKREEVDSAKAKNRKKVRREQQKQGKMERPADERKNTAVELSPSDKNGKPAHNSEIPNKKLALETTRLSGFDAGGAPNKRKRRKLSDSKLKQLQRQLQGVMKQNESADTSAEGIASNNDKAKSTADPGSSRIENPKQSEIGKALEKVKGVQVKDDVRKLKKSIRREKRKTEKSKEEWAKRVAALESEKKAKQEKRERNLKERRENKGKSKGKQGRKKSSGKK